MTFTYAQIAAKPAQPLTIKPVPAPKLTWVAGIKGVVVDGVWHQKDRMDEQQALCLFAQMPMDLVEPRRDVKLDHDVQPALPRHVKIHQLLRAWKVQQNKPALQQDPAIVGEIISDTFVFNIVLKKRLITNWDFSGDVQYEQPDSPCRTCGESYGTTIVTEPKADMICKAVIAYNCVKTAEWAENNGMDFSAFTNGVISLDGAVNIQSAAVAYACEGNIDADNMLQYLTRGWTDEQLANLLVEDHEGEIRGKCFAYLFPKVRPSQYLAVYKNNRNLNEGQIICNAMQQHGVLTVEIAVRHNLHEALRKLIAAGCSVEEEVIRDCVLWRQMKILQTLDECGCITGIHSDDLRWWSSDEETQLNSAFARKWIWPMNLTKSLFCPSLQETVSRLKAEKAKIDQEVTESFLQNTNLPLDIVKHVICSYF